MSKLIIIFNGGYLIAVILFAAQNPYKPLENTAALGI